MPRRILTTVITVALVATACSSDAATTTTTVPASTTSSTQQTTTTTTQPVSTTTSTIPYAALDVSVPGDERASAAVADLYAWFGDRTLPTPEIPSGLVEHLADVFASGSATFEGSLLEGEVGELGRVGIVTVNDQDTILLVDDAEEEDAEDDGWRVVGAWLEQFGADPWFGDPLRYVFVIGTDARPGELERHLRADSLHILSSNIADRSGGILGIPRDLRVEASYGVDKYTNVNAIVYTTNCGRDASDDSCDNPDAGQDEMVSIATEFSGLPLEGWIVTGFLGFQRLVDAFGGVEIDVPVSMADPFADAYLSSGLQDLFGADALAFSRNRKQFGEIGDFVRSLHQGMLMVGAFEKVLEDDLSALPDLLNILTEFTATNLSLEDLFTLAAGAFLIDPTRVGNEVVLSTGGLQGGAYYATFIEEEAELLFRDMDDGSLTPGESWLTDLYTD